MLSVTSKKMPYSAKNSVNSKTSKTTLWIPCVIIWNAYLDSRIRKFENRQTLHIKCFLYWFIFCEDSSMIIPYSETIKMPTKSNLISERTQYLLGLGKGLWAGNRTRALCSWLVSAARFTYTRSETTRTLSLKELWGDRLSPKS